MANSQKKKPQPRTIPQMLVETFFGSFRRFLGTLGVCFVAFIGFFPEAGMRVLASILNSVAEVLTPFVPFVATMAILAGVLVMLWKKVFNS